MQNALFGRGTGQDQEVLEEFGLGLESGLLAPEAQQFLFWLELIRHVRILRFTGAWPVKNQASIPRLPLKKERDSRLRMWGVGERLSSEIL
jgi:hypothetical protein